MQEQKTRYHSNDELKDMIREGLEYVDDRRALVQAMQIITSAYYGERVPRRRVEREW